MDKIFKISPRKIPNKNRNPKGGMRNKILEILKKNKIAYHELISGGQIKQIEKL